ncbi:MAG TPA: hypothetical protein VMW25_06625 [Clostridia bacterium]|nr:hypothetical protein [Clostridia bacterium]
MITLNESFLASITGYIGTIFDDFMPLILLVCGLFIGFYIIEQVIDTVIVWRGGTPRRYIQKQYGGTGRNVDPLTGEEEE